MIADDSDAIRQLLKDIISIGEHELVAEAKDGAEAVENSMLSNLTYYY